MRRLLIVALLAAGALAAQDCVLGTVTLTAATPTSVVYANKSAKPCLSWLVTYYTQGATAVSVSIQGAADSQGQPSGSYTALTAYSGSTNPATGTASGSIVACCDYYPFIRLNATTLTGTAATLTASVSGYLTTQAARGGGGGGGGGSPTGAAGGDLSGWYPNPSVAVTHLSSPLPRAQGGLNSTSAGTGILRDGSTPAASELSGDATTSGSNAVSVVKVNGAVVPASVAMLGSNSSSQLVAETLAPNTLFGNNTGSTAAGFGLTVAQVNAMLGSNTGQFTFTVVNETVTGTTTNKLSKVVSGANPGAIISTTADISNPAYLCVSGCGTSGSATLVQAGIGTCVMDATNASGVEGQSVVVSIITTGDCHTDTIANIPVGTRIIGQMVADSTASGVAANVDFHADGFRQPFPGTTVITATANGGTGVGTTAWTATSLALGGATIGSNALAVTGTSQFNGNVNMSSGSSYLYNGSAVLNAITTSSDYFFAGSGNLSTTGTYDLGIGPAALASLTTGSSNIAAGFAAMNTITTGSDNIAIGRAAGRYYTGSNPNVTSGQSIYIGGYSYAKADGDSNEIVIGYTAVGAGSNTVVIGDSGIIDVYFGSASAAANIHASTIYTSGNALTSAATTAIGTSGATIPLLNGANTWGANQNLGGNTLYGNSTSGGNLTLDSTSHATKGNILMALGGGYVGIGSGAGTPGAALEVHGNNGAFGIAAFVSTSGVGGVSMAGFGGVGYLQSTTTALSGVVAPLAINYSGGNVGIGLTSSTGPISKEEIAGGITLSGATFTLSTNTCSGTSPTGGATAGTFQSGTAGTCSVVVTMGGSQTSYNGWSCTVKDLTTPANVINQTATGTTTASFSGTTLLLDEIQFSCLGY